MLRNDLYKIWVTKTGEQGETPEWGIEILDGEFTGVVIQIVEINFKNNDDNLFLDYHTLYKPDLVDLSSNLWVQVLESIVQDIIKEALELVKNEEN